MMFGLTWFETSIFNFIKANQLPFGNKINILIFIKVGLWSDRF